MLSGSGSGIIVEGVGLSLHQLAEGPFFSSLCVVNEELSVRDATPKKTQSALSTSVPTSHCSSQPTLSQEQQEMVQVSSWLSQMSL